MGVHHRPAVKFESVVDTTAVSEVDRPPGPEVDPEGVTGFSLGERYPQCQAVIPENPFPLPFLLFDPGGEVVIRPVARIVSAHCDWSFFVDYSLHVRLLVLLRLSVNIGIPPDIKHTATKANAIDLITCTLTLATIREGHGLDNSRAVVVIVRPANPFFSPFFSPGAFVGIGSPEFIA